MRFPREEHEYQLLGMAKLGSQDAFRSIEARYQAIVDSIAHARAPLPGQIEDLRQEIWLAVFRGIRGTYDLSKPFKPWLRKVALSVAVRFNEEDAREKLRFQAATDVLTVSREEAGRIDHADSRIEVWFFLKKLRSDEREIAILHGLYGYTFTEIATVLDLSVTSVATRWKRVTAAFEEEEDGR